MKATRDLIGLNVFSVEEGRILGKTAECVVDLASGGVVGLVVEVKPGAEMGIARSDITSVGRDAVMVASAAVMKPLTEMAALVGHRTAEGKTAPQVLTRSGEVLGVLGTVHVDETAETVVSYEIVGPVIQALADGPATMPVVEGTIHGRDAVVLPDAAVAEITRPGGLRARLGKAVGVVREAATEVGQRVTTAAGKVRTATETAGRKAVKGAKAAAEVVEDKAADAVKAVKERVTEDKPKKAPKKAPAKTKAAPKKRAATKRPAKAAPGS